MSMDMGRRTLAVLTVTGVGLLLSRTSLAQEGAAEAEAGAGATDAAAADAAAAPDDEGPNRGRVSISAGIDYVSRYYFRGIVQELDPKLTLQPYAELGINLFSAEGGLSSVDIKAGTWNSIHSGSSGGDGASAYAEEWYESDFYTGFSVTLVDALSLGVTYTILSSPNDFFTTTHEIAFGLGYDDSALYGDGGFGGIQPSLTFVHEFDGGAMGDPGDWLGIAIGPNYTVVDSDAASLNVAVPVEVGIGVNKYYDAADPTTGETKDEKFGYLSAGLALDLGLGFIPAEYGGWSLHASGKYIALGENTKWINEDGDEKKSDIIFLAGVGLSY